MGTNILVGQDMACLTAAVNRILAGEKRCSRIPPLWDGQASERLADVIEAWGVSRS
jgi:UDP-N-acetylglucosamine 2-epimerase (non-hydrolysing)